MTRVIPVDRTVDDVAAFVSDLSTTEQWDPATVTCRRLDDGPVGIGSRFENLSVFRGRNTTLQYRIDEFRAGEHVRFIGDNRTVATVEDFDFEPTGEGTKIVYRGEFRFKRGTWLLEPVLRAAVKRLIDEGCQGLHDTIERL